jgi:hypothetical protein
MTPSGIEPATFRFVAQYLNHCATISGPHINDIGFLNSMKGQPSLYEHPNYEISLNPNVNNGQLKACYSSTNSFVPNLLKIKNKNIEKCRNNMFVLISLYTRAWVVI